MGTEQKEAQARSVGRQQLDVGLLEGQVSQDDGNLQHPLRLHVADAVVPRRVEEAVPALLARRTICGEDGDKKKKKKNPITLQFQRQERRLVWEIGIKGIYPWFASLLEASGGIPSLPCAALLLSQISSLTSASSTTSFQNCTKTAAILASKRRNGHVISW